MFLLIRKSKLYIVLFLLLSMTSCCSSTCRDSIEIPCHWHTALTDGASEDPTGFLWWEALEDPLLAGLIDEAVCRNPDIRLAAVQSKKMMVDAIDAVTADVAKSYIELRGLQRRLLILQESIELQNSLMAVAEGLLDKGFISSIHQNENKKNLEALIVQKSLIELSIKKAIFHISTLLSYPPGNLYDTLSQFQDLPKIPCAILVGTPLELIERHPDVQEVKKLYERANVQVAFYDYQKKVLSVLEEAENSIAAVIHSLDKVYHLENSATVKRESYQLVKDLYIQGFKDEQEILAIQQELLAQENLLIESKVELLINYVNLYQALRPLGGPP